MSKSTAVNAVDGRSLTPPSSCSSTFGKTVVGRGRSIIFTGIRSAARRELCCVNYYRENSLIAGSAVECIVSCAASRYWSWNHLISRGRRYRKEETCCVVRGIFIFEPYLMRTPQEQARFRRGRGPTYLRPTDNTNINLYSTKGTIVTSGSFNSDMIIHKKKKNLFWITFFFKVKFLNIGYH